MVGILRCASDWGCPPWEVTGEEPTALVRREWFMRKSAYEHQRYLKDEQDKMRAELEARMRQHGNWSR